MNAKAKKWTIAGSIIGGLAVVIGITYAVEYAISTQYEFELVKISSTTVVADGKTYIRGRVRLSKGGEPVSGHTIYVFPDNGTVPTSRIVTNSSGLITFTYYPYLYINDVVSPLQKVTITFQDESNSKIFLVPATWSIKLESEKPSGYSVTTDWEGYPIDN